MLPAILIENNVMIMAYHSCMLLTYLAAIFFDVGEMTPQTRRKRILAGHWADNTLSDAYPVFKYFVFMTKSDFGVVNESKNPKKRSWISRLFSGNDELNLLDAHQCSGSLVTHRAVLTACHCLARYNRKSRTDNYTYAWPLNIWEDRIYSYIGSNEVSKYKNFLVPQHYVIHETCRQLMFGLEFSIMDYGLIVTKETVGVRAPKAEINYAPPYRGKEIVRYYYRAIQKEYTCLTVGHGPFLIKWDYYDGHWVGSARPEHSEFQRWGWRTVMNYVDCLALDYPRSLRRKRPGQPYVFFDYTRDNTVVCLKSAKNDDKGRYNYNFGSGDSGGPVTCNNVFFAIVTSSDDATEDIISYASPIVHTMFLVAAEYRDNLNRFCDDWDAADSQYPQYPPDAPFPLPTHPILNPTPPPDVDVHPLSGSSLLTTENQLILLSLTVQIIFFSR